jgi:hypothetical protein
MPTNELENGSLKLTQTTTIIISLPQKVKHISFTTTPSIWICIDQLPMHIQWMNHHHPTVPHRQSLPSPPKPHRRILTPFFLCLQNTPIAPTIDQPSSAAALYAITVHLRSPSIVSPPPAITPSHRPVPFSFLKSRTKNPTPNPISPPAKLRNDVMLQGGVTCAPSFLSSYSSDDFHLGNDSLVIAWVQEMVSGKHHSLVQLFCPQQLDMNSL